MEIVMDIIIYSVIAAVAFIIGWNLRGVVILANLAKDPQKFIKMLNQIEKINEAEANGEEIPDGTELTIERVGNTLYAYAKETNQFIAQGPDLSSVIEEAQKRFPGKKFFGLIPHGDPAKELV